MKTALSILGISLLICLSADRAFASDDFQVQPPVFPRDLQLDESYSYRYKEFKPLFVPPLMYFTLAAQTERTWFDRRLAWDSYSAQFVADTGMFGLKQIIEIGFMSGVSNIVYWLKVKGIEPHKEIVDEIFRISKQHNRILTDEEIEEIIKFQKHAPREMPIDTLNEWNKKIKSPKKKKKTKKKK